MKRNKWFDAGMAAWIAGAAVGAGDPVRKTDAIQIAEEVTSVTTCTVASPRAFLISKLIGN